MLNICLAKTLPLSLAIVFLGVPLSGQTVRIIQTNAAGDNVHIIDPTTNRVVDIIHGIEIPHGVTSNPDGSAYYFSNETDHTLDVVPTNTLRVANQIPLTGRPNSSRSSSPSLVSTTTTRDATPERTVSSGRNEPWRRSSTLWG